MRVHDASGAANTGADFTQHEHDAQWLGQRLDGAFQCDGGHGVGFPAERQIAGSLQFANNFGFEITGIQQQRRSPGNNNIARLITWAFIIMVLLNVFNRGGRGGGGGWGRRRRGLPLIVQFPMGGFGGGRGMTDPRKLAEEYVTDLHGALGDRVRSALLFGSAARDEWIEGVSDVNVLTLVEDIRALVLALAEPAVNRAAVKGVRPLVMEVREWRRATDVFSIELATLLVPDTRVPRSREESCTGCVEHHDLFGYDKNVEAKADERTKGGTPDYVYRETKCSVLSAEGKTKIYPGIGFNLPPAGPTDDPETIYQCVVKAYDAA